RRADDTRGRQELAHLARREGEGHVATERDDAVPVGPFADALRARRLERGTGVAAPLGEVAAREPPDRAHEGERDRAAVVQRGVLAKAVHADHERVVDPDELVAAALRGRTLDPARPGGDARLAVEPRE